MMDQKFQALVYQLPTLLEQLRSWEPRAKGEGLPERGVYLFSEGSDHLYVGRTDRLPSRYREHCSGRNNDAPFAFKLARISANRPRIRGGPTRKQLEIDPVFAEAFQMAKKRVRSLEFRWVAIDDPNLQCLFEIYATLALDAKHNDFENH